MDVRGVGQVADGGAAASTIVIIITQCTILNIKVVATWIVHELAISAVANTCGAVCMAMVTAAMVGNAGNIGVGDRMILTSSMVRRYERGSLTKRTIQLSFLHGQFSSYSMGSKNFSPI
jgi:hypothetical protein